MQDFSRMVEETIRRGQEASGILATPVISEYFTQKTIDYVTTLLDTSTNMETIAVEVAKFRALKLLHDSLTQAVRDGLTAAERIAQQAKGDFR